MSDKNSKKNLRKTVEVGSKRIPLRTLLNGKEIRDAAAALEGFRMNLNEEEFLYGAKITIKWDSYDSVYAVARRLETDKEFADRLEKQRLAEEAKVERARIKAAKDEQRLREEEATKKARTAEYIKKLAAEAGILVDISGA